MVRSRSGSRRSPSQLWRPPQTGRRGAQQKFLDHAIETALTFRRVFGLPLRQAEGFLKSVLSLMGVDREAPDHTTSFRRSQRLDIELDVATADMSIHLVVDSSGHSIVGEGKWADAKHGERGKRGCKKLNLGVAADVTKPSPPSEPRTPVRGFPAARRCGAEPLPTCFQPVC